MDPGRRPGPELVQPGKEPHRRRARELRPTCAPKPWRRSKCHLAARGDPTRRRPDSRPRRQLTGKKLGDLKKPLPKKTLARRTGNLRSRAMKTVLKFPGSSKIWHGSGAFPAEIPTTAKPNHHLSPSFPRNPLSPPSDPVQRRLQSPPAKSNFLAVSDLWESHQGDPVFVK